MITERKFTVTVSLLAHDAVLLPSEMDVRDCVDKAIRDSFPATSALVGCSAKDSPLGGKEGE